MWRSFLEFDPSIYGDLVSNWKSYLQKSINEKQILLTDGHTFETSIEKEYLLMEKLKFKEKFKIENLFQA